MDLLDSTDVKRTYELWFGLTWLQERRTFPPDCVSSLAENLSYFHVLYFSCVILFFDYFFFTVLPHNISFSLCPYSYIFILFQYASLRYTNLNHWEKCFVSQEEKRKQGFRILFRRLFFFLNIQNFSTVISGQSWYSFLGWRRESRFSLYIDRLVCVLHCAGFHCSFYSRKCYGHATVSGCMAWSWPSWLASGSFVAIVKLYRWCYSAVTQCSS